MEPAGAAAVRLPLAPGAAAGLDRRMPSFDITCEVDLTEVKNATNMVHKELQTRFDFRGVVWEMTEEKNLITL